MDTCFQVSRPSLCVDRCASGIWAQVSEKRWRVRSDVIGFWRFKTRFFTDARRESVLEYDLDVYNNIFIRLFRTWIASSFCRRFNSSENSMNENNLYIYTSDVFCRPIWYERGATLIFYNNVIVYQRRRRFQTCADDQLKTVFGDGFDNDVCYWMRSKNNSIRRYVLRGHIFRFIRVAAN